MSINAERKERRKEERVSVSLPVSMAHADDVTHNISPSGVYFEVHAPFDMGQLIHFVVDFCHPGGNLKLKCQGEAIRVENRESKFGVAVKILESVMVAA